MSKLPPPATATTTPPWAVLLSCAMLGGLVALVALAGDLSPLNPEALKALAACVLILLDALPRVAGLWIAAAGLGYILRQRGVAQPGVGMAALLLLNYLAAWAGLLQGWVGWLAVAAGAVALGWQLRGMTTKSLGFPRVSFAWLGVVPGVAMLLVAVCVPAGLLWRVEAMGYDATSYHLQVPREWLAMGRMGELPHNVYSYLPGLVECAYARLMAMGPADPVASVYACQLFHASFVPLTVAALFALLRRWVSPGAPVAAVLGSATLTALPWVMVTGSLAYNEQAVLAFAAVALAMLLRRDGNALARAACVGLLCGAATLAKLTAALNVALPLGLLLVIHLTVTHRRTLPVVRPAAVCVAVGLLTLCPYLARNAVWTGNPVFPFATSVFGLSHRDQSSADRWHAAHLGDPAGPDGSALTAVWRQAVGNAGYGALGGGEVPREMRNVARFRLEGGLPVLWIAAALGAVVGMSRRRTRPLTAAMLTFLAWQFAWWLMLSHHQSRFLLLVVVPLAALSAVALDALSRLPGRGGVLAPPLAGGVLLAVLGVNALTVLWGQTPRVALDNGRSADAPLFVLVDGLPRPMGTGILGNHPVNALPASSRTLIVANNQALFYIRRPFVYASAFDPNPLAAMMSTTVTGDELAARLRGRGITHLYLGYSEMDRLHATYGFDAPLTTPAVMSRVATWPHVTAKQAPSVLVRVPGM